MPMFTKIVTERAVAFHLNKYKNYIMMSIDQGKPVLLVLLHLSAVFDTVDHNELSTRLKDMFGLSGKVL